MTRREVRVLRSRSGRAGFRAALVVAFSLGLGATVFVPAASVSATQVAGGSTAPTLSAAPTSSSKFRYTYYADGALHTVISPTATKATYTYDKDGNVVAISTGPAAASVSAAAATPATPHPMVSSVDPPVASAGAEVTISGTGFAADPLSNDVRIGTLMAHVVSSTASSLTVIVPPGSGGGAVTVATPGGMSSPGPRLTVHQVSPADLAADEHRLPSTGATPAGSGVTGLSGVVRNTSGAPLSGVTITVSDGWDQGDSTTKSDRNGRFDLTDLSPGHRELTIDGSSAGRFGYYVEPIDLTEGRTTSIPTPIWLDAQRQRNTVSIPVRPAQQVIVRAPQDPRFEIVVPKGTTITDHRGHVVTRLTITKVPLGRTPVPLLRSMSAFFDVQPGDASVSGPGLRVIYPNQSGQPAGTVLPYVAATPYGPQAVGRPTAPGR